jgi:hypothetical protein
MLVIVNSIDNVNVKVTHLDIDDYGSIIRLKDLDLNSYVIQGITPICNMSVILLP